MVDWIVQFDDGEQMYGIGGSPHVGQVFTHQTFDDGGSATVLRDEYTHVVVEVWQPAYWRDDDET